MTFKSSDNISQAVLWRLCMGCGSCVHICPNEVIRLVNIYAQGIRPVVDEKKCLKCGKCVKICPGIHISHKQFNNNTIPELRQAWGPVLEVWEGYAADPEIRFEGASGGVTTAISLFCLEQQQMAGVLHIGADPEEPLKNIPFFSRNREELLAHTGSRYSPAAPCEKLTWIEESASRCVFIGKPCDIVGLRKLQLVNPVLNDKIGLAISIFCAGTPSTKGTYKLLDTLGVKANDVKDIRYRGRGWPGMTTVKQKGNGEICQMTYDKSWGDILSGYGQFRCNLCPDSTGEFADIACGDPWHRDIERSAPGYSLVLVRTENGREILSRAMQSGYVTLVPVHFSTLPRAQKAILNGRRNLFGQLLAMRFAGVPTPSFDGFSLLENWRHLKRWNKVRSVLGMLWHIISEKLYRPQKYLSSTPTAGKGSVLPLIPAAITKEER